MTEPSAPAPTTARAWHVVVVTAVVYALLGIAALSLAEGASVASPVYPSAGVALAAALVFGWPALLGTLLGSAAVNLSALVQQPAADAAAWAVPWLIGAGAALQAALGRALLRRFARQPTVLDDLGDVVKFLLLGALLASVVSASVGNASLWLMGVLAADDVPRSALTWWVGDALGVLVGAPITLALLGRPASAWAGRRAVVAVPMAVACVLLAGATSWANRAHHEQVLASFDRTAAALAARFDDALQAPLHALQAAQGAVSLKPQLDADEWRRLVGPWLEQHPQLLALGVSERARREDVAALESAVVARGGAAGYRVFDRADAANAGLSSGADVVAITMIEPLERNRAALGVNALSVPAARRAIERAAATGEAAATEGFQLTQGAGGQIGIVIYRALYQGQPATDAERRSALRGVVFATLDLEQLSALALRGGPGHLSACLVDADPGAVQVRLAGPPGCEAGTSAAAPQLSRVRPIGPRVFEWRISADPAQLWATAERVRWLFPLVAMVATALLGALLLTLSGRERRVASEVDARTAELRATGEALAKSEERLRRIVDNAPIGVIYADGAGRVQAVNPALRRMLGISDGPLAEGARREMLSWLHPDDRETARHAFARLAGGDGQAVARLDLRLLRPDGHELPVRLSMAVLHGSGGQRPFVAVLEDISEHLRLAASEKAREAAEAASRAKSEFVGRISHELRTPLNAMLGFAQLISHDEQVPKDTRRWGHQIQDAGWHLLNLINDTLDLSLVESGALRLKPRPMSALGVARSATEMLVAAAERRGVTLHPPEAAPHTPPVLCDETRLRQILTNMLSNAIKYNRPGGELWLRVGPADGGRVAFAVSDSGIGMTEVQAAALFQPFNRLGREQTGIEGAGIGLVLSRRLADAMDGRLRLQRTGPEGSTFVLELPAAAAEPGLDAPAELPTNAEYHRRQVHYVEDNEVNVLLMQGMLAQRPQIELSVSALGLDALAAVRERRPDLILLDMHLPDIDGQDLLHHLKSHDDTASIPVLALSADVTPQRIERVIAMGAAGYLPKPVDLQRLLEAVDEILEQAETRWL